MAVVRLPLSSLVLHNITRGIFEAIVEQAPLAIEDLMKELAEERDGDTPSREPPEGEDRAHLIGMTGLPCSEPAVALREPCLHLLPRPLDSARPTEVRAQLCSQGDLGNKHTRCSLS